MVPQANGQQLHIALGAQDVVAGLGVAGFREMGQGADADGLDQLVFFHAPRHLRFQHRRSGRAASSAQTLPATGCAPGQHHVRLDRLGDVVGGAVLEAALLVARIVQGGEKDDRNVPGRRVLFQAAST
jgi:hypothetical protein